MLNSEIKKIYRISTIGMSLQDAIEGTPEIRKNEELIGTILDKFDAVICEALEKRVANKVTFKGHLHTFRLFEGSWTMYLEKAQFTVSLDTIENPDFVKIIALELKPHEHT